jgi:hypothetical protein
MAHYLYESLAAFGRDAADAYTHAWSTNLDSSWTGDTWEAALQKALRGDTAKVARAEQLLSKLEANIELKTRQWVGTVAGAFPSVPDYLSGHPESMRRLTELESDQTPLRVFVDIVASASLTADQMERRGIAVLAVAMALTASRPVELWTCSALDGADGFTNVMIRIASAPLQLSEACAALCNPATARALLYALCHKLNHHQGGWAKTGHTEAGLRKMLGTYCQPTDLVIKPTHANDEEIIQDPVAWLNQTLKQFSTNQDE